MKTPVAQTRLFALYSGAAAVVLLISAIALSQSPLNREWFQQGQALAAAWPDGLWSCLTVLGLGASAYALLSPALVFGRPDWIAAALFVLPVAAIATRVPKNLVASDRPAGTLSADQLHIVGQVLKHSSFPSGHSLTAFAFAAVIIFLSKRRGVATLVLLPLAGLIAFSRIAVGAHWPADVLAGAALGWICGVWGAWAATRWRWWNSVRGTRVMAGVIAVVGISLFFEKPGYPPSHYVQYLLGIVAVACGGAALVNARPMKPA